MVSLVSRFACRSGLVTWRQRFARRSQFTLAWLVPQGGQLKADPYFNAVSWIALCGCGFDQFLFSRLISMQHFELFELGFRCRKLPLQRGPLGVDAGAQIGKLGGHLHLRDAITDSDAEWVKHRAFTPSAADRASKNLSAGRSPRPRSRRQLVLLV